MSFRWKNKLIKSMKEWSYGSEMRKVLHSPVTTWKIRKIVCTFFMFFVYKLLKLWLNNTINHLKFLCILWAMKNCYFFELELSRKYRKHVFSLLETAFTLKLLANYCWKIDIVEFAIRIGIISFRFQFFDFLFSYVLSENLFLFCYLEFFSFLMSSYQESCEFSLYSRMRKFFDFFKRIFASYKI